MSLKIHGLSFRSSLSGLTFLVLISGMNFGCSDAPSAVRSQAQRTWNNLWIPLAQGNQWVYSAREEVSGAVGEYRQFLNHGGAMADRVLLWGETEEEYLAAGTNTTYAFMDTDAELGLDICYMDNQFGRGMAIGARPASEIGDPRNYVAIVPLSPGEGALQAGPARMDGGTTLEVTIEPVSQILRTEIGEFEVLRFDCIYRNAEGQITARVMRMVSKGVGIVQMRRVVFEDTQIIANWSYNLQSYEIF